MPVFDPTANLAYSTVALAPSPATSGATLTVATGEGARFPSPPFQVTVWPPNLIPLPTNAEIWRITGVAADVLTGSRAQEGTAARTVLVGDQIAETVTAKMITDMQSGIFAARAYSFFTT